MTYRLSIPILLVTLCLTGAAAAQDTPPEAQGALVLHEPQERELGRGEVHTWTVRAEAGQYMEVVIEEPGVRVFMRLLDPEGEERFDGEPKMDWKGGSVPDLRWVADREGDWVIAVKSLPWEIRRGRYVTTWTAGRERLATDNPRLKADSLMIAALALPYGSPDRVPMHDRALAAFEEAFGPDHPEVARMLVMAASANIRLGRLFEARPLTERALSIAEQSFGPNAEEIAIYSAYHGDLLLRLGQFEEAVLLLNRAFTVYEEVYGSGSPSVSFPLVVLGGIYRSLGRYSDAETVLLRAYEIQDRTGVIGNPFCGCMSYLARIYVSQGRYEEAEPLFLRAERIAIAASSPTSAGTAGARLPLADLYWRQERYEEADSLARLVLAAVEAEANGGDHMQFPWSVETVADVAAARERHSEAVPLYARALLMRDKRHGPDHPLVGRLSFSLARSLFADPASSPDSIRTLLDRSIDVLDRSRGFPEIRIGAYALRARLSKLQDGRGAAILDLQEAIYIAEDLRPNSGGSEEDRARLFGSYADLYDHMIAWQIEDDNVEEAFAYAERGRGRVLLDQLAAGKIDIRAQIPADILAPLEAKETSARARLAGYQQRITLTRGRPDLDDGERLSLIASLEDSLLAADREYADVYRQIKNASPLWRDMLTSGGDPVRLRDVQRKLIGRDDVMLLYEIGKEASHVFVITSTGPPEALPLTIGAPASSVLGVPEGMLTQSSLRRMLGDGDGGAAGVIAQLSTRGAKVAGRAGFSAPDRLHALWQTLVPPALWTELLSSEAVVLIPDAMLHLLPFEALVTGAGEDGGARYWLDDGPVIRYSPSATVLEAITQRPDARVMASAAPLVLSLSDPIYNPSEVDAGRPEPAKRGAALAPGTESAPGAGVATRNSFERAGGTLMRLPGTALESEMIAAALGDRSAQSMVNLQGQEATETNFRSVVRGKRHLHLATHGIVDQRRGGLFASLAMTPPSGLAATLDNDGYLQLHEIYDLPLDETELAVLSACESNVGPEVEGEGVFALSRGFLAAGSRRVVASQWAVDDASTAELVGSFFGSLLSAGPGAPEANYAVALRDAKRAVRAQEQWSDPYYWAPFILAGKQ